MDRKELLTRLEDRYEGNIDEFIETLQITMEEVFDAFEPRILLYLDELDIGADLDEYTGEA